MPFDKKTYIFILDDHRSFCEEIKGKFDDRDRYALSSYQNIEEFRQHITTGRDRHLCRIAILILNDNGDQTEVIKGLVDNIKSHDSSTGVIVVYKADKIEDINNVGLNADVLIPRNTNSLLRIHNAVKRHVSGHTIGIIKRKRNVALYLLLAFTVISLMIGTITAFLHPEYF